MTQNGKQNGGGGHAEQVQEQIVIEAQNLTKRFGNFVAVDRVNFRIQRGEIFGFLFYSQ